MWADNPTSTKLSIHVLAAVARHEREQIRQRTKDALAAANRRGVKLGGFRGHVFTAKEHKLAAEARRAKALTRAAECGCCFMFAFIASNIHWRWT